MRVLLQSWISAQQAHLGITIRMKEAHSFDGPENNGATQHSILQQLSGRLLTRYKHIQGNESPKDSPSPVKEWSFQRWWRRRAGCSATWRSSY